MSNWLDKYEQGGLVLKQKTKDNYGKKPNPNDVKVSTGPNYVGSGYDIQGRDYSPAWGGRFQGGGYVKKKVKKTEKELLEKYVDPSVGRAFQRAQQQGINTGIHNGPLDAIRHSSSAAAMTSALPTWTNFIPGVAPLKIAATNAAGIAHELNAPNDWKEHASDLYNNFIGSVVGALPISEENQHNLLIQAQKHGVLSNMGNTKPLRKKQMGGYVYPVNYVPQAQDGEIIPSDIPDPVNGIVYDPKGERTYYDDRLDRIVLTPSSNFSPIQSVINHEKFHKYQFDNLRSNYDIAHKGAVPLIKKPSMVASDEEYYSFHDRKPKEVENDIKYVKAANPNLRFVPDQLIFDKIVGNDQYSNPYSLEGEAQAYENSLKKYQMGGSLPGAVGFTYARTQSPAPSNGPYAKKTKASAQNGAWLDNYDVAQNGKKTFPKFNLNDWKKKKEIDFKERPREIVAESTGVEKNNKGKGEKQAKWVSDEIKKGNNIVKHRGDYAITANNKVLVRVNREGQQEQYVPYKQLAPGEKLNQEEINKIDTYKDALDNEDLGFLRRPLTYLEAPEKILGDIGIPGMETSEDDRLHFVQRDFHPDNANMTLGDKISDSFNYGVKKIPGATLNVGLAMLGNPEAGALRVTGEAMNPLPMPLPGRGMKVRPGEETARFFKQADNVDDTFDLIKPKNNAYNYPGVINEHVAGIGQGISDVIKGRPFFEAFPITKAQKEASYLAQDKAMQEGIDFVDNWFYKDGQIRPEVKSRIDNIYLNESSNLKGSFNQRPLRYMNNKLVSSRSSDLPFENITDQSKEYLEANRGRVAGFNSGNTNESITLRNSGFYNIRPEEIKNTVVHEAGHSAQDIGDNVPWGELTTEYSPELKYYTSNPNTNIGKRFKNALRTPGKASGENYAPRTWKSSPNELHSELMSARSNLYDDFLKQGKSSEEAMNLLQNPSDETLNTLIKNGGLDRFFKQSRWGKSKVPMRTKRDLIKLLPALVPVAAGVGALEGQEEVPQQKEGGVIKDNMGQWAHPGEVTEIGSNQITMEGVPYDVLGISDEGDTKLMKPGKNYKFKGKKVTEYPMAKNGLRQEQKSLQNLDNLTNFTNYNKPQPGGWLNKYN